jgi:protein O-mannosyl-transferase
MSRAKYARLRSVPKASPIPDAGPRWSCPAIVLVCAAAAFFAYITVLQGPYLYDDIIYVRDNASLQSFSNIPKLWVTSYFPDRPEAALFRPLTATTYGIDIALAGISPLASHISNGFWHALATALLVLLVLRLHRSDFADNRPRKFPPVAWAALAAGLIFAVHPVHTEAISGIVGRAEVLAALFCFAATLSWLKYRQSNRWRYSLLTMLCFFLGLCSKESAAPLPAVLLVGDWLNVFSPDSDHGPSKIQNLKSRIVGYLPFAVVFAGYTALRLYALGRFGADPSTQPLAHADLVTRLATSLASVGRYTSLMIWPAGLSVEYGEFTAHTFASGRVILGVVVAIAFIVAVVFSIRRAPKVVFWLGWFLLFLLTFSNLLITIGAVFAERFVYISSAGFCVLAGLGIAELTRRFTRPMQTTAWVVILLSATVALEAVTLGRNQAYQDEIVFWRTAVAARPHSAKVLSLLGRALATRSKTQYDAAAGTEAEVTLRQAIAISARDGDDMERMYALYDLGDLLFAQGRDQEAAQAFAELVSLSPEKASPAVGRDFPANSYLLFGVVLQRLNRHDQAIEAFDKALAVIPNWPGALIDRANSLRAVGRAEEALTCYREALPNDPTGWMASVELARTLVNLNRGAEAESAVAAIPEQYADAAFHKGHLYERLGRPDLARKYDHMALDLNPGQAQAKDALGKSR